MLMQHKLNAVNSVTEGKRALEGLRQAIRSSGIKVTHIVSAHNLLTRVSHLFRPNLKGTKKYGFFIF